MVNTHGYGIILDNKKIRSRPENREREYPPYECARVYQLLSTTLI